MTIINGSTGESLKGLVVRSGTHVFLLPLVLVLGLGQQSRGLLQFGLGQFVLQLAVTVDLLQTLNETKVKVSLIRVRFP